MTLYELIELANSVLTPQSRDFYDYVLWTSDDNGGFLRTCYKKKSQPLKDKEVGEVFAILVAFDCNSHQNRLTTHVDPPFGELTDCKLQFFYAIGSQEDLEGEKEWSAGVGFPHFVVINR